VYWLLTKAARRCVSSSLWGSDKKSATTLLQDRQWVSVKTVGEDSVRLLLSSFVADTKIWISMLQSARKSKQMHKNSLAAGAPRPDAAVGAYVPPRTQIGWGWDTICPSLNATQSAPFTCYWHSPRSLRRHGFGVPSLCQCRRHCSAGELYLPCARLPAGWVTTLWLSRPLSVNQHGQLIHPSPAVGKWVVIYVIRYRDYGMKA